MPTAPGRMCAMPGPTGGARAFRSRAGRAPTACSSPPSPASSSSPAPAARSASASASAIRPWGVRRTARAARALQRLHPHGAGRLLRRRHADHQGRPGASTSMTISASRSPRTMPAMDFEAGWTADGRGLRAPRPGQGERFARVAGRRLSPAEGPGRAGVQRRAAAHGRGSAAEAVQPLRAVRASAVATMPARCRIRQRHPAQPISAPRGLRGRAAGNAIRRRDERFRVSGSAIAAIARRLFGIRRFSG